MEKALSFEKVAAQDKVEEAPQIELQEIAQLQEPVQNILEQIKDKINAGEYGTIIGDDASGRIPALIFNEVINSIYIEAGHEKIDTKFLAGSKYLNEGALESKTKKLNDVLLKWGLNKEENRPKTVLVVTEAVALGKGMRALAAALYNVGINFDIVTISLVGGTQSETDLEEVEANLGAKIYYGTRKIPGIYNRKDISGVYKNPGDVFSIPHKKILQKGYYMEPTRKLIKRTLKNTRQARKDAHILSKYLAGWYKEKFLVK